MRGYTQLTQEERYQIFILKKAEYSQAEIAGLLERDNSTISRELRQNRGLKGYRPKQAHNLALLRTGKFGQLLPYTDEQRRATMQQFLPFPSCSQYSRFRPEVQLCIATANPTLDMLLYISNHFL